MKGQQPKGDSGIFHLGVRPMARLLSATFIFCFACIDPYAPDVLNVDYGILVIDGYFVPNDTTRILLSRTVTMDSPDNMAPEPAAQVRIEGNNGFKLTLSPQPNHTYTAPPVAVDYSASYRLLIHTSDGREYASDFVSLAARTVVDSVAVHEKVDSEDVTFNVYAHDPKNASRYYSYQFDETWEYIARDYSVYKFQDGQIVPRNRADELYTCWRTRSGSDISLTSTERLSEDVVYDFPILSMKQSDRRLYFAYSLNARQYVLTPEGYTYWKVIRQNSEELGSLFDPLPAQPHGNFSCTSEPGRSVIGFFTASDVTTARVVVKRDELRGPNELYQSDGYENCPSKIVLLEYMNEQDLAGWLINDKRFDLVTFELIGYSVYPEDCLNCRLRGGTTVRPAYWR
ncbi:DUF4249 domain-containing protein [Chryseolinea sp. T2]|uniref:DUF4249 domain-containing protein n=1 Tax=Chryseolinea sp. T2 TaxID=3129255 RepID=UPI003077ABD1